MKMDRNIPENEGCGKYALINMRKAALYEPAETFGKSQVHDAIQLLDAAGVIQWGVTGAEDEFFLIKLKDRNSHSALLAYADSIKAADPEFAAEVYELASRAGIYSPFCKDPD